MKMHKNLKISLLGKSYCISTDEQEEDILKAAELVDTLMKGKGDEAAPRDEKMAMAVALQLATDLTKQQKILQKHEEKAAELISLLDKEL